MTHSTTVTKTTRGMGSFPYVPPEQMIDLRNADERSDIFALGKILQLLLTGELPVVTPHKAVPQKYRYFIEKCCEPEPNERYQAIAEVIDAFDQAVRGVERPQPVREVAEEHLRRWRDTGRRTSLRDLLTLLE